MKSLKYFALLFSICLASLTSAQSEAQEAIIDEDVMTATEPVGALQADELHHKFMFISADMEHGGKLIKGAPYRAEAVTERTQTLADGNRIVHKSSAKVFRDNEGRTRREQQLSAIGNWEASEDPPRRIFIHDPVAGMHYILEPENQTARKINLDHEKIEQAPRPAKRFERFMGHAPHPGASGEVIRYRLSDKDAKKESLGKQTIEGIQVEGTRTTITVATGEMGNELPIQIVSERWYSPELQINVMSKHSDPRFGETVYQLTRIGRGEQDRSLFEIPKDYKVEDGARPHKIIRREKRR